MNTTAFFAGCAGSIVASLFIISVVLIQINSNLKAIRRGLNSNIPKDLNK